MATATLIIYRDSKIEKDRNMKLDFLSTYLGTLTKISITGFQYQRTNLLEFDIKIDKEQSHLDYATANNYDYCSLQNSDSNKVLYYFITERRWKSKDTIEFHLVLDTINSFSLGYGLTNGEIMINDKTNVTREHRDRFSGTSTIIEPFADAIDLESLPIAPSITDTNYTLTININIPDNQFTHVPLIDTNFIFFAKVYYFSSPVVVNTYLRRTSLTRGTSLYEGCHRYQIKFELPRPRTAGSIVLQTLLAQYNYNSSLKFYFLVTKNKS